MYECRICNWQMAGPRGIGAHLKKHNITNEEYYNKYIKCDLDEGICIVCGDNTKFISIIKGYSKHCSCNCAQNNESTKKIQSDAHLGHSRLDMIGNSNPAKQVNVRKKISLALRGNQHTLGRKFTEEQKKSISNRVKQNWDGNIDRKKNLMNTWLNPKYYKCGYFYSRKNNKEIYYRSSYELRAFKILEKDKMVLCYELEPFALEYWYKGQKKHYFPDLLVTYIDNIKHIIEIKPYRYLQIDDKNKYKFIAARKYAKINNMQFIIWTEENLFIRENKDENN